MDDHTFDLRALVRRDVRLAAWGCAGALVTVLAVAAGWLGLIGERPAAWLILAVAAVVWVACLGAWLRGPRALLRDRYLLLVPLFLTAGPAVVAVAWLANQVLAYVVSVMLVCVAIPVLVAIVVGGRRQRPR
jgi:hypothetical protein